MNKTKQEKFLFIIFCFFSLFFHYASNAYIYISNELLLKILLYINLFLHLTFKPIEVFFHEASHGLVAIATGQHITALSLSWNGSGYVIYEESSRLSMAITAFFGYAGASIWGYLIYRSSLKSKKINRFLLMLFCLSFLYFSADIKTVIILSLIIVIFFISWSLDKVGPYLLRFIGIFIMVSAIFSPTYLLNHSEYGDHMIMQSYTDIPSILWIAIWFFLSLFCLYEAFIVLNKPE